MTGAVRLTELQSPITPNDTLAVHQDIQTAMEDCTYGLWRFTSDGPLDLIGCKDSMIKLGGQRIELGAVEFHLRAAMHDSGLCDNYCSRNYQVAQDQ